MMKKKPLFLRLSFFFLTFPIFISEANAESTPVMENLQDLIIQNTLNANALWVTLAAGFVFLMQAGFMCYEAGMVRSKTS
ncbi:ammonium transporter, partial [bacterium]|nr:ammonium transporter [bacterium]